MTVSTMDPDGQSASFQHEMNRMFDQFSAVAMAKRPRLSTWTPPVDIYETDDALVIKVELPGVAADDVSIDVHQNTLTLRGERKHEGEVKDEHYHRVERPTAPSSAPSSCRR